MPLITYQSFMATVVLTALLSFSCSNKIRKAGDGTTDPTTHYRLGMQYWDAGDNAQAQEEFNLAKSLDSTYAPAYAGLALTTAITAKERVNHVSSGKGFTAALDLAHKAQALYPEHAAGYIAMAVVITLQNEGTPAATWINKVESAYAKALATDSGSSEIFYRRGLCYKNALVFSKAATDFKWVLDKNKEYTTQAKEQLALVEKIELGAPGTEVGKKIALIDKLTRADIAALFVLELQIDTLLVKKMSLSHDNIVQPPEDASTMQTDTTAAAAILDINDHWAKQFILATVSLHIRGLEPYPDHTFHPNLIISRGEFALMIEDALIAISGDNTVTTSDINTVSRFADVSTSHPAYHAICSVVGSGIMDAAPDETFGMVKPVSGAEALLVIRNLKNLKTVE